MLLKELAVFEVLSTPIWVVHPFNERVVYANQASRTLSGEMSLNEMRNGIYSTCPETQLQHYLRYLDTMSDIRSLDVTHRQWVAVGVLQNHPD